MNLIFQADCGFIREEEFFLFRQLGPFVKREPNLNDALSACFSVKFPEKRAERSKGARQEFDLHMK